MLPHLAQQVSSSYFFLHVNTVFLSECLISHAEEGEVTPRHQHQKLNLRPVLSRHCAVFFYVLPYSSFVSWAFYLHHSLTIV